MTVEARIKAALDIFGDPVENGVYHGSAAQYYAFNCTSMGADYADDIPNHEKFLVQVHFFAPLDINISKRIKATKHALLRAGFTWPECTGDADDRRRHIVFECEIAEGID